MKKLLNRKQKGFTIVELVIVIAVIGILAGVLIPVFINLNNKANKAADEALVKNLNTALATQEQEPGDTKNATFHDAVVDLKEYGYLLPNLVAKSDEDLLWDRETNRFLLEEDAESDKTLDYWRIQNNLDEQKYNVYAGPKFNATSVTNLKVGFDAGDYEGLTSVSYVGNGVSAQEVVIRTNTVDTDLTINAEFDTVHHFDKVGRVTIDKIDMNCYNEFGKAAYVKLSQGKIVAKEGGEINVVFATNADSTKVAVIKEKGAIASAYTTAESISTANQARPGGIPLTYSINDQPVTENIVNEYVAVAIEENKIEEIEHSDKYQVRIGATGYEELEQAVSAASNSDTIVLTKNILHGEDYTVAVWTNKGFNIDLNGHTFETQSTVGYSLGNYGYTASAICYSSGQTNNVEISNGSIKSAYGACIYADDPGLTLTLSNVNAFQNHTLYVQSTGEYSAAIRITGNANVVVNSGSYEGHYSLVVSNTGGHFVVNGGTFTNGLFFSTNGTTSQKTIVINGGTFNNFSVSNPANGVLTIKGGTFDADPTSYVDTTNYNVTHSGSVWTVSAKN